jgi:transposase
MSRTAQIAIKKLQDPKGSKSEIKKMKFSAIFYLTKLGFSQYDISNMIDMKRTTVEGAINRVATTVTTLTRKSMGRPSSFDDYTKQHLQPIIKVICFKQLRLSRDNSIL